MRSSRPAVRTAGAGRHGGGTLLVGADGKVSVSMQSAMSVTNFCYQQPFRQAIAGGDDAPLLKKLVGGWVRRDFANDSTAAYQTMMLALQFNVREGVEPARAMLKDGGGNPHMRQYALLVIGKFGEPEDLERLEPLLNDRPSTCQAADRGANRPAKNDPPNPKTIKNEVIETQIRDVTLAVMIHLSGQKPADFGFARIQPNATILFNTATLGFSDPSSAKRRLQMAGLARRQAAPNTPTVALGNVAPRGAGKHRDETRCASSKIRGTATALPCSRSVTIPLVCHARRRDQARRQLLTRDSTIRGRLTMATRPTSIVALADMIHGQEADLFVLMTGQVTN